MTAEPVAGVEVWREWMRARGMAERTIIEAARIVNAMSAATGADPAVATAGHVTAGA